MKAGPLDWLKLGLALGLPLVAIVSIALLLNFTGDCAPGVTDCGEPQRVMSFAVLGLGIAWLAYIVVRFIRSPTGFR